MKNLEKLVRYVDGNQTHYGKIVKYPNASSDNYIIKPCKEDHNIFVHQQNIISIGRDNRGGCLGEKLGILN